MNQYPKVIPYDKNWPKQFTELATAIKKVLKNNCIEVHHVADIPHIDIRN